MVLTATSNELAEDSVADYLTQLEAALGRAIGKKFDRAVLIGSGAGQPLGLLNSPATIVASKEVGQAAGTFLWDNAIKMWARLAPGSNEASYWLMSPTLLPQGLSMAMAIGTGGTVPMSAFAPDGQGGYTLMGRPVVVTSRLKVAGTVGDVILCDPTQLAIGIRRQITIDRSPHAMFTSDRLAIRGKFRGDAQPLWEKPQTTVDSQTVSPFVVLQTRA